MQEIAITTQRPRAARSASTTLDVSRVRSVARIATIIAAVALAALLSAGIVAASLGLGADDHHGFGPDRPPAPVLVPLVVDGSALA
jgi:hypothetical protein